MLELVGPAGGVATGPDDTGGHGVLDEEVPVTEEEVPATEEMVPATEEMVPGMAGMLVETC